MKEWLQARKQTKDAPTENSDTVEKARRRAASVPTHDLQPWIETSLYIIGRSLSEFNKDSSNEAFLIEAVEAGEIVAVLLREFKSRIDSSNRLQ